jgi:hypothetical protein
VNLSIYLCIDLCAHFESQEITHSNSRVYCIACWLSYSECEWGASERNLWYVCWALLCLLVAYLSACLRNLYCLLHYTAGRSPEIGLANSIDICLPIRYKYGTNTHWHDAGIFADVVNVERAMDRTVSLLFSILSWCGKNLWLTIEEATLCYVGFFIFLLSIPFHS